MKTPTAKPRTRIISIGGGKGGVGKSIVSCNLAVAMAQLGNRVVLADLDLGAANQHLLLGVDHPKPGINALLSREVDDPRTGLSETPVKNLSLLAGAGAKFGVANITYAEKLRLIRRLRRFDADVVLVDVGAGVGYNALDFFELGAQRIVVTTPQVTAIHDAYSFLKSAVLRTLQHTAEKSTEASSLDPATASSEGDKVVDILARLRDTDPEFADRVFHVLANFGAQLIGNQVTTAKQTGIFQSISKMMHDYLGITVPILGWLKNNPQIAESVNLRAPLMLAGGQGEHARALRGMAESLLVEDVCDEEDLLLVDEGAQAQPSQAPIAPETIVVESGPKSGKAATSVATKVRIYQPPPRKRKPDADKRRVSATVDDGRRRRRPSLPGLTPAANSR